MYRNDGSVFQVSVQWFCFTLIFVLYMKFYPEHRKYVQLDLEAPDDARTSLTRFKTPVKSSEWRTSLLCAWVTLGRSAIATLYLMLTAVPAPAPDVPLPAPVQSSAMSLGVASAILAVIQYATQLVYTYTIGALNIPMMCMQSPGAVLMILGIALRAGKNWTSWFTFFVAGVMQATLLVMCIAWKFRQRRLGFDDFGYLVVPRPMESGGK